MIALIDMSQQRNSTTVAGYYTKTIRALDLTVSTSHVFFICTPIVMCVSDWKRRNMPNKLYYTAQPLSKICVSENTHLI